MVIERATQIGNPVIRAKSAPVPANAIVSSTTKRIVRNLIDSMRHHGLVGMAAPQIGIGRRIFVAEVRHTAVRNPEQAEGVRAFINPKIIKRSTRQVPDYEGCGSVAYAGIFGNVMRSYSVTIQAFDLKGKKFTLRAEGLLARIIQHETDHLDGKVFLDRMPNMTTLVSREELLRK